MKKQMETRKIAVIGVTTSLIVAAVAAFAYVFSPKPAEILFNALEFVSRGADPDLTSFDDIINVTIRWKGYDGTQLTIDVYQEPPRGAGGSRNQTVNYGDIFVVEISEWHSWAEISADKYPANQTAYLSNYGDIEPIYG
jgi:hypothetical protein